MDPKIPITAGVAVVLFLLVSGVLNLARSLANKDAARVKGRLQALAMTDATARTINLVRREELSDVPWLNRMLGRWAWVGDLGRLIRQGEAKGTPGMYIILSLLLACIGFLVGKFSVGGLSYLTVPLFADLPFRYLRRKRNKRMEVFQKQLPDALDLIARALKAGHTFGGGMRLAADEFPPPMGKELAKTLDEVNFGMDVGRAMENLIRRVECTDLKFFVVAVNIQRETGGNLAEIVSNIAGLVRERYVLFGKVRVLSAEGRLTAWILLALPIIIACVLYIINADYMGKLLFSEFGHKLLIGAACSMTVGTLIILRMIKIKV